MSDSQDIREWARAHGYDVADKGRLPGEVRDAYEQQDQPAPNGDHDIFVIEPEPEVPAAPVAAVNPGTSKTAETSDGERPPRPAPEPRRGLFQRKPTPPAPGAPRPKPKARPKPAVSIENVLSTGWALAAMGLARKPEAIPVARILDMQAPVAGVIGDELLRGTVIHRILQPLARGGQRAEMAVALVGPPLLVGIITAKPETFPVLRPMLKMSMMTWLEISEPAMAKEQARQQSWAEKFGDVDLDAMIDALWAGLPTAGPPSDQEEQNIRKARGE